MKRINIKEAEKQGFTVDHHCYPHFAYKGSRFNPTETRNCFTPLETDLVDLARTVLHEQSACRADVLNPCWREGDPIGLHWGSEPGKPLAACAYCHARAIIASLEPPPIASGVPFDGRKS